MSTKATTVYRQILRAARTLPTENRRLHVRRKARAEFEKSKQADQEQLKFLFALAEAQIDNIKEQARHLQYLFATGKLKW